MKVGRQEPARLPGAAQSFRGRGTLPRRAQCPLIPPLEDFMSVIDMATGQDRVMLLTFFHLGARRGEECGDLGQGGAAAQQDSKKSCGQSPSTTERYLRSLGYDLEELREAVEVFSGRGPAKILPFAQNENPRSGNSRGSEYPVGVSTGGPNG